MTPPHRNFGGLLNRSPPLPKGDQVRLTKRFIAECTARPARDSPKHLAALRSGCKQISAWSATQTPTMLSFPVFSGCEGQTRPKDYGHAGYPLTALLTFDGRADYRQGPLRFLLKPVYYV